MAKSTKASLAVPLDIDPDEFLERTIRTKPSEVEALIKRGKKKKPPGSKRAHKPSGGTSQAELCCGLTPQADAEAGDWSLAV